MWLKLMTDVTFWGMEVRGIRYFHVVQLFCKNKILKVSHGLN